MSVRSPFSRPRPRSPTRTGRFSAPRRLRLEPLDDRCLPSLTPAVSYPAGTAPRAVVTADFNNDGHLDLATADGGTGAVSILTGAGDGTFGPARAFAGAYSSSLTVADVNGDGNADLVTLATGYGSETVWGRVDLLLGNGDGTLRTSQEVGIPGPPSVDGTITSYGPTGISVADVNADGRPELWIDVEYTYYSFGGDSVLGGTYSVLLVDSADSSYGSTVDLSPPAPDMNGDGLGDYVATAYDSGDSSFEVGVVLRRADGSALPTMLFPAGPSVSGTAVGDFNGDRRPDVAAANAGSHDVSVLLNDGAWPAMDAPAVGVNNQAIKEGNAGTTAVVFTLTLSAAYGQPVTVRYRTADNSATAGSDYQSASGAVTFAPGETTKTVAVLVNGDRVSEPDEYFVFNLDQPANAFLLPHSSYGWCRIEDDDTLPQLRISDVTKSEGRGGNTLFTFTVTLSAPAAGPVTVRYATSDGTARAGEDYTAASGTLTFAPGETSKTITIVVKGDKQKEANETFSLNLTGATGAGILDGQGLGTILNDD
jgi:Calx-beta domain/FG-GAP-like repeat